MSTYFGWQRVIWFDQLLMQYEIFWRGMHYELMHYELVYCTTNQPIPRPSAPMVVKAIVDGLVNFNLAE